MQTSMPDAIKEIIQRNLQNRQLKYSAELRSFAITLQFYSAKAYNYIRKKFNNLLPCPSVIRKWFSVVNGHPGFTKEAFQAIQNRTKMSPVLVNIVIDEMAIRQQILYCQSRYYGYVDFGVEGVDRTNDNLQQAHNALVFMAVALNGQWKIPLAYFLISGLSGNERANLLKKCLQLLEDAGAIVCSICFDGAYVNGSMCASLGANLEYGPNFRPFFTNPATGCNIYIIFDPCHMIKLVRNTLGAKQKINSGDGKIINWQHFVDLVVLQDTEKLHATNKLTKKHILYEDNKMNVRLAVQTLSSSVASALHFAKEMDIEGFKDVNGTAEFAQNFNDIFDLLNCRSKFSKKNKIQCSYICKKL
jgi:hypothetical protein